MSIFAESKEDYYEVCEQIKACEQAKKMRKFTKLFFNIKREIM